MEKNMAAGGGGDKQPPPPQKKSLMMIPPPDEERCSRTDGLSWRCTNLRMNLGVSRYCENHYNSIKEEHKNQQLQQKKHKNKKKKKSNSEDGDDSSSSGTETWDSTYMEWKKVKNHRKGIRQATTTNDTTSDIEGGSANIETKRKEMERKEKEMEKKMKLPPDEERCSKTSGTGKYKYRCKNFRMGYGANAAANEDYAPKTTRCEKHYKYFTDYFKNLKKKKKKKAEGETRGCKRRRDKVTEEEDELSLDVTCDYTSAGGSSANFMTKEDVDQIQGSGELTSLRGIREPVVETRSAKRRKMMVEEGDRFVDETSNQPATNEGGSNDNDRKRKYAKRMSGELESLAESREPAVELESLEHYKTKCIELSVELGKKELELEKQKVELQKKKLELENMSVELKKKKVECTELQGKLAEVETRKAAPTNEIEKSPADECLSYLESEVHGKENDNSTMGCVEDRVLNLESQVLRMERENSTKAECVESRISKLESQLQRRESRNLTTAGCVVSRISNLKSLEPRMENGNLTMAGCGDSRISKLESLVFRRCVELRNSERVESGVPGLQNVINQSCEKPTDESNSSKVNAETSIGGRKDFHMYDIGANEHHDRESEFPKYSAMNISSTTLHLSSEGQYVEEGKKKGWGSSSSRDHLEMSAEPFADLVSYDGGESFSESEDSDSSGDSETSLGSLMDMLAMKYRHKNDNKEMK